MPDMLSGNKADIENSDQDSDGGEEEKQVIMIVGHNVAGKQILYQVHSIFDHHCTQPRKDTNDHTQDHDKIALAHILDPPDQETS